MKHHPHPSRKTAKYIAKQVDTLTIGAADTTSVARITKAATAIAHLVVIGKTLHDTPFNLLYVTNDPVVEYIHYDVTESCAQLSADRIRFTFVITDRTGDIYNDIKNLLNNGSRICGEEGVKRVLGACLMRYVHSNFYDRGYDVAEVSIGFERIDTDHIVTIVLTISSQE